MRVLLRTAAAAALAIGAALGLAMPAFAAPTPAPTPASGPNSVDYVTYAGSTETSSENGHDIPDTLPSAIRIDCTRGTCVLTEFGVTDNPDHAGTIDFTQGMRLVLVDGKGTFAMPTVGDLCGTYWIGEGSLTVSATATGFSAVRTSTIPDSQKCADGSDVGTGPYQISFTAAFTGGSPCILDGSCPTPSPTPTPIPTAVPLAGSGFHPTRTTRIDSPSTLSALPTASQALTPHGILYSAAVTVVLVLLVAFPTYLLNNATSAGASRAREWWDRRRPKVVARAARLREVEYKGWPFAAAGVLVASLISSFVDPTFGFNAASVRVYFSILLSFLLDAVVGWFLLIYLVRRVRPHTSAKFQFSPVSLLVVIGAVVFTRLTGFAPGIIFGLVAGVVFGTILATAEKARVALVGLGYSFVVAVIGWIGYSALGATAGPHPGAWEVFFSETLSSMAVGGIAALPIALIPFRGLSGYDIFAWNRWVWGGAYAIGLLGFFVVLMPLPLAWSGVHVNLVIWVAVYIAYALIATVAWLVFARPWKKPDAPVHTETPEAA